MTILDFPIAKLTTDGYTQVRVGLQETVVTEYAERMQAGAEFPLILVYHDSVLDTFDIADGHHRRAATARIGRTTIPAEVVVGTRKEALLAALRANVTHGLRRTEADKTHAIKVTAQTWPEKSQQEIALIVGCTQQYVSQVLAVPAARMDGQFAKLSAEKADEIAKALRAGQSVRAVSKALGASSHTVARVRDQQRIAQPSPITGGVAAAQARVARIRVLADEGYTSRQICAAVQLTGETVHKIAKRYGIDIAADRAMGKTVRHDSNRIIARIVMDAENLVAGSDLVDFNALDPRLFAEWLRSLKDAREQLGVLIRRLMQEQQHHGETAQSISA